MYWQQKSEFNTILHFLSIKQIHCHFSADGACRHIAASLYALEDFEKPSVTSGPCLWKRRALSQTEAVPIKKLRIESVGYVEIVY